MFAELLHRLADLPEPEHSPSEARDLADEILARPEYSDSESILERISNFFEELLTDVLSGLSLGGVLPGVVAWILLFALLGAVAALVAWGVRSWNIGGIGRAKRRRDEVVLDIEEVRSPSDWLGEAVRHEAEGRWREGLLCRYRALVTQLVRHEVIAELAGRTAGEYVHDVRERRPDLATRFAEATGLFEEAWYGGVETGPTERDRFAELADRLLADARNRSAPPTVLQDAPA